MNHIEKLQDAIRRLHGCASDYLETVPITERFQGRVVWSGDVEVFRLIGHPKAIRCYAWSHADGKQDDETRYVAVLEIPPVKDARTAVQAAIVSQAKTRR